MTREQYMKFLLYENENKDNEVNNYSLEDFAIFFINFLRNQTDGFIKGNATSSCNTPPVTSVTVQLNQQSNYDSSPNSSNQKLLKNDAGNIPVELNTNVTSVKKSQTEELLNTDQQDVKSVTIKKRNTSFFSQSDSEHSPLRNFDRSKFNDSLQFTSTPTYRKENRRNLNDSIKSESSLLNVDSQNKSNIQIKGKKLNRSFTENSVSQNKSKSSTDKGKSSARQTLCLGDFIVTQTNTKQKRRFLKDTTSPNNSLSNSNPNVSSNENNKTKPKRRVVPTLVNPSTSNTFSSPVLRNENNILKIAEDEIQDHDPCVILKEREVLKNELTAIAKEFEKESSHRQQSLQSTVKEKLSSVKTTCFNNSSTNTVVDLSTVTNRKILDRFIEIHSALIDLNLTINVLGEISYLLNLLNIEDELPSSSSLSSSFPQIKSTSVAAGIISCNEATEGTEGTITKKSPVVTESTSESIESVNNPHNNDDGQDIQTQIDPCLINRANNEIYTIFKKLSNCIYFALGVLTKQKYLLALLDVTTLRVILDNERLENLNERLKEFLMRIYTYKIQLETKNSGHEISFRISSNFTNVSYQQDNDTKNNFPSQKEFNAFNKQRDMFYTILRIWESKHLNHTWNFSKELSSKINELFNYMEHPINMAHLAKLFTSQLIISSNFSETPTESEIAELNVDRNKLSKLRQRLVAPSNFSTDYQFPGNQIFFKEFLMITNSIIFLEQIKMAIISELMEMNDSSYEIINLESKYDNDDDKNRKNNERICYNEYVVRPETISTMRMLAKFLGLVMSRPFIYDGCKNAVVDNRQIELRNMLQPTFDIMAILEKAIVEKKLIITLPWVVQYLFMLDHITLRLTYYHQLTQLLYELYINLSINHRNNGNINNRSRNNNNNVTSISNLLELLQMRPTSILILKLCLGWLFDNHSNISEDYYNYRRNRNNNIETINTIIQQQSKNTNDNKKIIKDTGTKILNDNESCVVEQKQHKHQEEFENLTIELQEHLFDPLLEGILNVACPFLADFRVSIMPTKFSKCPSRSGRYRHITTRMSTETTTSTATSSSGSGVLSNKNGGGGGGGCCSGNSSTQTKLIESFLHSQSLSMRRTVEFVIERTTSAVIKDYQMEVLLPSKAEAMNKISQINSTKREEIIKQMRLIYTEAHKQTMQIWNEKIPKMIETRVKKSLEGLLPNETMDVVRKTCTRIIIEKCKMKTENWKFSNLNGLDFYSKNIINDSEKIFKNNTMTMASILAGITESDDVANEITTTDSEISLSKQQSYSTKLTIDITKGYPSKIFDQLQYWLHFTISRSEFVTENALEKFCIDFLECLQIQKLPTSIYRISGLMTIALVQNLIIRHENIFTKNLMEKFINIWLCDRIKDFIRIPEKIKNCQTDEENTQLEKKNDLLLKNSMKNANIFDSFITKYFIQSLGNKSSSFDSLSQLLILMVNVNIVTIDYLNEQFLALFKEDWSEEVFKQISKVLDNVCKNTSQSTHDGDGDNSKSQLFMEMLADFSRELEF